MSGKRKNVGGKKGRGKSRKVEYDEEDISSEQESEVDDAEVDADADPESGGKTGGDATEEDTAEDVSNIPELHPPEVRCDLFLLPITFIHLFLSFFFLSSVIYVRLYTYIHDACTRKIIIGIVTVI